MIILLSQSITTTYRVRFVLIVPARKYTQRYQQFFWLSYSHQSSNTQIMRTGNNNDSITIINNNNNNNNNNIYDNSRSNWPFLDVVRMEVYNE